MRFVVLFLRETIHVEEMAGELGVRMAAKLENRTHVVETKPRNLQLKCLADCVSTARHERGDITSEITLNGEGAGGDWGVIFHIYCRQCLHEYVLKTEEGCVR